MKMSPWTYFRRTYLPYIFAYTAKWCARIIFWTCRKEIQGLDNLLQTAKDHPCILMLWHNNLIIAPEVLYNYANTFVYSAFISNSRDGEPLAILAQSYRQGRALRVPHNQRHTALHAMISRLKEQKEIMVITPDGPRGPKHVVKPGVALAAKASGAHIVPFMWSASSLWRLNTWDAMKIPKPFSKITVNFGTPRLLEEHLSEQEAVSICADMLSNGK